MTSSRPDLYPLDERYPLGALRRDALGVQADERGEKLSDEESALKERDVAVMEVEGKTEVCLVGEQLRRGTREIGDKRKMVCQEYGLSSEGWVLED
ncbi:MAG: hypothetical protein Q9161_002188 [Pseudevernia consocians]